VGLSLPVPFTLEVKQTDVSPDAEITSPTEQSTVTFSSVGTGLLTSMPLLLVEEVCHDSMPAAMSRSRSLAPLSKSQNVRENASSSTGDALESYMPPAGWLSLFLTKQNCMSAWESAFMLIWAKLPRILFCAVLSFQLFGSPSLTWFTYLLLSPEGPVPSSMIVTTMSIWSSPKVPTFKNSRISS